MLSKVNQTHKLRYHMLSFIWENKIQIKSSIEDTKCELVDLLHIGRWSGDGWSRERGEGNGDIKNWDELCACTNSPQGMQSFCNTIYTNEKTEKICSKCWKAVETLKYK